MEAVKAFDREWKKQNSWDFLMSRVCKILFSLCGAGLMFIPVEKNDWHSFVWSLILLVWAMHFQIRPYMRYTEEGSEVSIYEKLKWMPVSRKDIFKVRREYLAKFCLKVGAVTLALQQIGACLSHSWEIFNLLAPVALAILLFLLGIFDIDRNLRR
ncbi:MAG: hypothetical protein NC307_03305 [Roseburia sp.]|nr:hypothetical protein [Roseburia sp.]